MHQTVGLCKIKKRKKVGRDLFYRFKVSQPGGDGKPVV